MKFTDIKVGEEYAHQRGRWNDSNWRTIHRVRVLDARTFVERRRRAYETETFALTEGGTITTRLVPEGHEMATPGARRYMVVQILNPDTGEVPPVRSPHMEPLRELHIPWSEYAEIKAERAEREKRTAEAQRIENAKIQAERVQITQLLDDLGILRISIQPVAMYDNHRHEVSNNVLISLLEHAQRTGWKS